MHILLYRQFPSGQRAFKGSQAGADLPQGVDFIKHLGHLVFRLHLEACRLHHHHQIVFIIIEESLAQRSACFVITRW